MASLLVAREAPRLHARTGAPLGCRDARLATTLLRYASRAALKLSPFATFTQVGTARAGQGARGPALAAGWTPRSLVRLRRHLVDRCLRLLSGYPPLRRTLEVAPNHSATPLPDGRIVFQRPGHYRVDEDRKLVYLEDSLVTFRPGGEVLTALEQHLSGGPVPYARLLDRLAGAGGMAPGEAHTQLERLLDVGWVHLLPPWPVDEPHAEKVLLDHLSALPADPRLDAVLTPLERLVSLQDGLLASGDPGADLAGMRALIAPLLTAAASLGGIPDDVDVVGREWAREIYQDVWCDPLDGAPEVIRAGREPLERALRDVRPLVRYTRLFDPALDWLYTLGAFLRREGGGRGELPFMEALRLSQKLWQEHVQHRRSVRAAPGGWRETWNPLGLPVLEELARARAAAWEGLPGCWTDGPGGREVSPARLEALLAPLPARWTDDVAGACLFLQPASSDGSLWMLNRVKEGTGRFASRYTALMEAGARRRYGAALAARGRVVAEGEPAQLLDVLCVQGDTLNVHAPQTLEALVMPGTRAELPVERQRTLRDLRVTLADDDWPTLRDPEGTRYLPVHLGVGYVDYMPTLVKVLCAFGPTELAAVFPRPLARQQGDVVAQERTTLGSVVLHRRLWRVPTPALRDALTAPDDAAAFRALHAWLRERGIPARVFVLERTVHPIAGERSKPQYVDLTSPLFLDVLRSVLESAAESVTLVEPLPDPSLFPRDGQGRRWAVELLVDSLALREPSPASALSAGPAPEWVAAQAGRSGRARELV